MQFLKLFMVKEAHAVFPNHSFGSKSPQDGAAISVPDPDTDPPRYRIHMFSGLPDPGPDPLVRGNDPDTDPSIIKQK